jgi:hypothetical protein
MCDSSSQESLIIFFRFGLLNTIFNNFLFTECGLRNIDLRLYEPSFYGLDGSQYDDGTDNFEGKVIYIDHTKKFVANPRLQYRVSTHI